jgi:hypothetical protein
MKLTKKIFCILTALLLVCAMALPAFAQGVKKEAKSEPVRIAGVGDLNRNGVLEAADALIILRYVQGIQELSPELIALCDADANGTVNSADALTVLRAAVLPAEPGAFFLEIEKGVPAYADLDGDGAEDTVLLENLGENEELECEYYVKLTVTLAADPENAFVRDFPYFWLMSAAVVDFDPSDARMEIVFSTESDEMDQTVALRLNDAGGFDLYTASFIFGTERSGYHGFPAGFRFYPEEGLPMMTRTEIFGTYYLNGRFTLTGEGLAVVSDEFSYPSVWTWPLTLLRPMDVTLEDGSAYTVPEGAVVIPRLTDMASWAAVELEDGRLGYVEVSFDHYHRVLINGIDQDEYAVMPYAD